MGSGYCKIAAAHTKEHPLSNEPNDVVRLRYLRHILL